METSAKVGLGVAGGLGVLALLIGAACAESEKKRRAEQEAKRKANDAWKDSVRSCFRVGSKFFGVLKEVTHESGIPWLTHIEVDIGSGWVGKVEIPKCTYSVGGSYIGDSAFVECLRSVHATNGSYSSWNAGENEGRDITDYVVRSLLGQRVEVVVRRVDFASSGDRAEVLFDCPAIRQGIDDHVENAKRAVEDFTRVRGEEERMLAPGNMIKCRIVADAFAEGRVCLSAENVKTNSLVLHYHDELLANHPLLRPAAVGPAYNPFESRWERRMRIQEMQAREEWRQRIVASGVVCNLGVDVIAAIEGEHEFVVGSFDSMTHTAHLSSQAVDACIKKALSERRLSRVRDMAKVPLLIDGSNLLLRNEKLNWKSVRTLVKCLNDWRIEFHLYFDATIWPKLEELKSKAGITFLKRMLATDAQRVTIVPSGTQADDFILQRADAEGNHILSHDGFRQQEYRELYPWLENRKESGDRRLHPFDVVNGVLTIPDLYIYEKVA